MPSEPFVFEELSVLYLFIEEHELFYHNFVDIVVLMVAGAAVPLWDDELRVIYVDEIFLEVVKS